MLELINISKQFTTDFYKKPIQILHDISFKVEPGKIIGFLGANGAGKTTTIKILMNFVAPTSGDIIYSGELSGGELLAKSKIGYLPERPYFYPHLKGMEFLRYMGELNGIKGNALKEAIKTWSERLKIAYALDRKVKAYSKGMLQRLGMVSALLHDPALIILDEPLSGLDPIGRKDIKDVIRDLRHDGKTVFFSSHILPDVEEVADELIFIEGGKVVFSDSIKSLYDMNISDFCLLSVSKFNKDDEIYESMGLEVETFESEKRLRIEISKKSELIAKIIEAGGEIISLHQETPTLEEVFYKVKNEVPSR